MVWLFDGFRTERHDLWDPSPNMRGDHALVPCFGRARKRVMN